MPYQSPAPGSIPIIAIWPIPKKIYDKLGTFDESNTEEEAVTKSLEIMRMLKDAGFNVVMNGGNFQQMNAMIYTADKAGVNTNLVSTMVIRKSRNITFHYRCLQREDTAGSIPDYGRTLIQRLGSV